MRALTLLVLAGCSDYVLKGAGDPPAPPDTAAPPVEEDSGPQPDTADSAGGFDTANLEPGIARAPIYLNEGGTLFAWNPAVEGDPERIGNFVGDATVSNMTDIAVDMEGRLFGCTRDALWEVNAQSGRVRRVATLDAALNLTGLTFVSDGRLVGAGDGLYFLDPATGAATVLVAPGPYETSGDVVGLPDGLLYWAIRGLGSDRLAVVDPDNGQVAVRGEFFAEKLYGLGFANDRLYAFGDDATVRAVDPADGTGEVVGTLGTRGWYGATTNPVRW
jgi:hypothetical protein